MTSPFKMLIDGDLVSSEALLDVVNPATGQPFAAAPRADTAMLERAIAAARRAFPAWAGCAVDVRAAALEALAAALEARAPEFARLLTSEQGKPLDQAMGEVIGCTYILRAFRDRRLAAQVLRDDAGNRIVEHRRPLGVVAAITPWNFPLILLMNKLGPALITGNTMVIKPAPTTPLTTLLFGELCAGVLPPGVVNIIVDDNDLGAVLTTHPGIDKVAFTGSTATGKKVMASAAGTVKRVTLELGGNDAAIVLDDVTPALAARKVFDGAMVNAGQVCVAIKRAYVPAAIYDDFCDAIAELARTAVVDDGSLQGTTIGPIQNRAQFAKVAELLEDAARHGTVIAGGKPLDRDGFFIPPTIVRDLPEDARLVREEQFGPVLPVLAYDDLDEVIDRVNASEFGLGGTVWGTDVARATAVAERIVTGTVWVNHHLAIDPDIPFRGARQSGLGGELGQDGLHEYTQAHIINAVALA
jgi:acyl-CoA reductase-like NAD-dependent aldehyde dehydrogenase